MKCKRSRLLGCFRYHAVVSQGGVYSLEGGIASG